MDLFMGSQNQKMNVIIDTGSSKLIMIDSSVAFCKYTFDSFNSQSYWYEYDGYDSISYLDGSYIDGYKSHDRVSLDALNQYSVPSFNFLLGYS